MPLYRRVPKRGFHNIFAGKYAILNVKTLNRFDEGTTVTPELLREKGILKKIGDGLRILGEGKLENSPFTRIISVTRPERRSNRRAAVWRCSVNGKVHRQYPERL